MTQVFVYGTLRSGQRNNFLLRGSRRIGSHVMWARVEMFDVGFPVLLRNRKKVAVIGELYEVDRETLKQLDMLEGNGRMYRRVRKRLGDGTWRRFWVYIGEDRFWDHERNRMHRVEPVACGLNWCEESNF